LSITLVKWIDERRSSRSVAIDVPLAPRRAREVDPFEDHGERGSVDGNPLLPVRNRRQLKCAGFEAFREDDPSGSIEEQDLHQATPTVEEQVQASVLRVEAEAAHSTGKSIERTPHVDGIHCEEDPHGGW
jgi:hypothetical protein